MRGTRGAMRVKTSQGMVPAASAWSKAVMDSLPCEPRRTTSSPCSTPANLRYVDNDLIHADATDERRALAANQKIEMIAERAGEAVAVPGGDQCDAHGLCGDEGGVVADGCAGRNGADAYDRGLPGENWLEGGAGGGERRRLGWSSCEDGRLGWRKRGIEVRDKPVEGEAGAKHGFHPVTRGQVGNDGRLAGEQRGGRADVEPLGEKGGGGDAAHGFVKARELLLGCLAVGFVGGEKMRHHAFKAQRRARTEAREDLGEIAGADALAAHAGVDFKVDGHGTGLRSGGAGGGEKLVELPRLPRDGSELKLNGGRGLAREKRRR